MTVPDLVACKRCGQWIMNTGNADEGPESCVVCEEYDPLRDDGETEESPDGSAHGGSAGVLSRLGVGGDPGANVGIRRTIRAVTEMGQSIVLVPEVGQAIPDSGRYLDWLEQMPDWNVDTVFYRITEDNDGDTV